MLIVVDDEDRENEGDLLMAAEKATPEAVNFMAKYGRGLICVPMLGERLDELQISMMVSDNTAPLGTAFTVSVDARRGVTTGTSAYDRAVTIRTLVDPATRAEDLTRPGHIFPLRAMPGGVLRRAGHTEAAVDLARLAGFAPAGVICEVLDEEGGMARLPELAALGREYNLKSITIKDLIEYRIHKEKLVQRAAMTRLPTEYGEYQVIAYETTVDDRLPLALVLGDVQDRRAGAGARALGVPHRRRLRLPPLRLRLPAPQGADDHPARRGAACSSTCGRRGGGSACSTSSGPTSCRIRARTRWRPTTRSASAPTCATTASAPRSWSTSGSRTSRSSPTTRRRSWASRATASRWWSACPSRCPRPTPTGATSRTKREKLGHLFSSFPD